MASTPFRLLVEAAGSPRQPYGAAENRIPAVNSTELCRRIMPLPACRRSGHVVAPYAPELYRMYHSALPQHPIILIPTRLAAARLPRKPLADIAGSPMILPGRPPAGALFLEGGRAVGRGAALRAYRPLRLPPRRAGALCDIAARRPGTARALGAVARAGSRDALLGQPDRQGAAWRAGRYPGRSRTGERADERQVTFPAK